MNIDELEQLAEEFQESKLDCNEMHLAAQSLIRCRELFSQPASADMKKRLDYSLEIFSNFLYDALYAVTPLYMIFSKPLSSPFIQVTNHTAQTYLFSSLPLAIQYTDRMISAGYDIHVLEMSTGNNRGTAYYFLYELGIEKAVVDYGGNTFAISIGALFKERRETMNRKSIPVFHQFTQNLHAQSIDPGTQEQSIERSVYQALQASTFLVPIGKDEEIQTVEVESGFQFFPLFTHVSAFEEFFYKLNINAAEVDYDWITDVLIQMEDTSVPAILDPNTLRLELTAQLIRKIADVDVFSTIKSERSVHLN